MSGRFKLILGLGFKDKAASLNLALLWAKAGADIIDCSFDVLPFIQEGFKKEGLNLSDYEFCVSTPVTGDIHGKKAKIDPALCKKCGHCKKACIQNAILPPVVDELKCIGCKHCKKVCKYGAISFYDDTNSNFIPSLNDGIKLDTVEIHISIKDKKLIKKEFKKLIKNLPDSCKISVCLNRTYFSNTKAEKLLSKLNKISGQREFVVQADGNSMNNAENTLSSTIETVAFGLFVKSLGYDVILSGGTNDYTAELAKKAGLECDIAFGSYARKLTENLDNEAALNAAKEFVSKVKNA